MIPVAVILAQLLDAATFAAVISLGVPGRELNPAMASLAASLGLAGVMAAKLLGAVAIGVGAWALSDPATLAPSRVLRRAPWLANEPHGGSVKPALRRCVLLLLLAFGVAGTLSNIVAIGGM